MRLYLLIIEEHTWGVLYKVLYVLILFALYQVKSAISNLYLTYF